MLLQSYIFFSIFFHLVFSLPKDVQQKFNPSLYQDLKAARSYNSILRRSDRISIVKDIVLTYADEHNERTKFASRVKLSGNRPTLVIEEFDHLLDFVDCADSTLSFGFRDSSAYSNSKDACSDLDQGLIVASHASCSNPGTHSVYEITNLRFDDESKRLIFETQPSSFRDAFKSHKVDFGRTSEPHYFHRHERLARRQSPTSTLSRIPESVTAGAIPTQTYDVDTLTLDLTQEVIDTTFELPFGVEVAPAFPISIGCKECTTTGSLVLSAGEVDLSNPIGLSIQSFDPDQDRDLIKAGYFEAELNGFEASILLSATPSGNVEFAYDLFTFAPAGFNIPGFGSVGVIFQPQIAFDIGINGGVEFTWGFNLTVPDQSRIRLDIAELSNSSITGLENTAIGALPFNANASDIELSLSVGLRPFIALGMSFFDEDSSSSQVLTLIFRLSKPP
ncbi:hypothetical protein BS50DRAFT_397555 [Corynespora cassiicola Philippines]|uniref:Acid protease n=1 Tax=Corynespora cassiicola Philippines TaxID=1448308 RepID=A0A2T2NK09_CORCC|nr:hypothetical protein BS50DRAFT_397555 [Corynespora cassiicola Philippines]